MAKCLITGAAGFIGSHLYEQLTNEGHSVTGIDNLFHPCKHPIGQHVLIGDVRKAQDMKEIVKWADIVYHLAAQIHVDRSIEKPQETIDINVTGTLNILEAVRKYNKAMVFASSSEVYGTQQYTTINHSHRDYVHPIPAMVKKKGSISETHPMDAQSPYAASKAAGDRLCKAYHDTYGTRIAILRNFNTFGAYQSDDSYGGAIAIFTRQALLGEQISIFGSGDQERDYMSVGDAVRGYELCVEEELWGQPVNIGTGKTIQIRGLAQEIVRITNSKSEIVHTKARPGEVSRLCANISFAKSKGFKPKTKFNEDLQKYVQWYKSEILPTIRRRAGGASGL